jgi:hypothetical protein
MQRRGNLSCLFVHKALRWNGSVVGVATIIGDAQRPDLKAATIKGPVWYVVWFSETTLKGSFRRVDGGMPTLRIYSRQPKSAIAANAGRAPERDSNVGAARALMLRCETAATQLRSGHDWASGSD